MAYDLYRSVQSIKGPGLTSAAFAPPARAGLSVSQPTTPTPSPPSQPIHASTPASSARS